MKNLLSIIFISLIIVGCNREENNERKALSHCADIKYIKNLNAYPQILVNKTKRSEIIQALQTREEAINEATFYKQHRLVHWCNGHDQGNYRSIHSDEYQSKTDKKYEYY